MRTSPDSRPTRAVRAGGYRHAATACCASSGVLVNGKITPLTPASRTRFAVHISFTGTRANVCAASPRVASTMLRSDSSVTGECSISTQRKSKPAVARCAATSVLFTVIVAAKTGRPSRNFCFDGTCPGFGAHFLISQTSETWQPRPLPPSPGSRVPASSPALLSRSLACGMSNSTGRTGAGFAISGWTSTPFATSRILRVGAVAGVDDADLVLRGGVEIVVVHLQRRVDQRLGVRPPGTALAPAGTRTRPATIRGTPGPSRYPAPRTRCGCCVGLPRSS